MPLFHSPNVLDILPQTRYPHRCSAAYDLHDKLRVYARSGVLEYIAVQMYEQQIDWFVLREGVYETLEPDENGVIKSEVFPGLWLNAAAFWSGDLAKMLVVLQQGLASPEHAALVTRLQEKPQLQSLPTYLLYVVSSARLTPSRKLAAFVSLFTVNDLRAKAASFGFR